MSKIKFGFSKAHFNNPDLKPEHGPQHWPWWKLLSISIVKLGVYTPSTGRRMWIYTRRGAVFFEWFIIRRASA